MSRPIGTADELERRRKQAVQAVSEGHPRKTVAKVLGVHYKTVARWVRAAHQPGGVDAKPRPAPAPGLNVADLRRLEGLPAEGAKAHGWHNQLRTAARVARLIEREFRLRDRVVDELVALKFRPDLPRGFVRQTGLPGVSLAE